MKRKDVVIDVTSIEIGWGLAAGHGRKRPKRGALPDWAGGGLVKFFAGPNGPLQTLTLFVLVPIRAESVGPIFGILSYQESVNPGEIVNVELMDWWHHVELQVALVDLWSILAPKSHFRLKTRMQPMVEAHRLLWFESHGI